MLTNANRASIILVDRHARDADTIAADNANIYRVVAVNGSTSYRTFGYDASVATPTVNETRGSLRIRVRAVDLLDYTPGGPDFVPASLTADIGGADEVHGESGDDTVYGQRDTDFLFGDAEDDDLLGGWGHDWISAGSGDDGVLGDDGRISTSRNGVAEPLYGIGAIPDGGLNLAISTPGRIQTATINVSGQLRKTVNLTPFNLDPAASTGGIQSPHFNPAHADDLIYGGLGDDWLHGGAGDDGLSGAEALAFYFDKPSNAGNVLNYSSASGEFAAYDEYNPRQKIFVNPDGSFNFDSTIPFVLNFNANDGAILGQTAEGAPVYREGNDRMFGDLGNDWLVGGPGNDNLYGGYGDDLMNADDNHDQPTNLNNAPETHVSYEDRAYGGAGRDILIGNTGGDRLIDWAGEFNSFIVPFSPFGAFAISRALSPGLMEFLYALSESDGADPTRAVDEGRPATDPRNGEPFGELGLVMQKDFDWQDQTGAPNDPQPGNIPGGARDVLRGADFNNVNTSTDPNGTIIGFGADTGTWSVQGGRLQVTPLALNQDAASVFYVDSVLPTYFEVRATINADKPVGGWKSNAYVIFDYVSPTDFKYAGVNVSTNKFEMGHRNAAGWFVDSQKPVQVKPDTDYNVLLSINGLVATIVIDNIHTFSFAYTASVDQYGVARGLNRGMVGLGAQSSRARIDNLAVQILPPAYTLVETETFNDGIADRFTGPAAGAWQVQNGRFIGAPLTGQTRAFADVNIRVGTAYMLRVGATLQTTTFAGLVFDQYAPDDFKFAAISPETNQVILGHYTARGGWKIDAALSRTFIVGQDYELEVTLKGTTASVSLNGQAVVGFVYNAATMDGSFGTFTDRSTASFDRVSLFTNDLAFLSP